MMKAVIDSAGFLHIARGTRIEQVLCPKRDGVRCGDWCAVFGEPATSTYGRTLDLCEATIEGRIEDLRPHPPPPPRPPAPEQPHKICQVCGERELGQPGAKAAHFEERHPEYKYHVLERWVKDSSLGHGYPYKIKVCDTCGKELTGGFPTLVQHYQKQHLPTAQVGP